MSQSTVTNIIKFGDSGGGDSGLITAEIDGFMHLDAKGEERSSFSPGESVYFIIHYDPAKVKIISLQATDGGDVRRIGDVTRERTEQLTFQHPAHLIDLSYMPKADPEVTWYGRSSNIYRSGCQLQADLAPCLGDLVYEVEFVQYLHKPAIDEIADGEEYPTDVIIEYQEVDN